jgi:hypothetical protein
MRRSGRGTGFDISESRGQWWASGMVERRGTVGGDDSGPHPGRLCLVLGRAKEIVCLAKNVQN